MAELIKRPKLLAPGTAEAEILGLIVEGVCCTQREFAGFCSVEGAALKRGLSRLSEKGFVYYIKKHRAWRPTDAGTEAYDDMRETHFKRPPEDIVGKMFDALVAVQMRHKSKMVREDAADAILAMQRSINVHSKRGILS